MAGKSTRTFLGNRLTVAFLVLACSVLGLGLQQSEGPFSRISPRDRFTIRDDNTAHLVYALNGDQVASLTAYLPWDSTLWVDIDDKPKRRAVQDTITANLPADLLAGRVTVMRQAYREARETVIDSFDFSGRVNARSLFTQDTTLPVLRALLLRNAQLSSVRVQGWREVRVDVRDGVCQGKVVAIPVVLNPGENQVIVRMSSGDGTLLQADTVSLFYRLAVDPSGPPADYAAESFHVAANDSSCASACHLVEGEAEAGSQECSGCHTGQLTQRFVHGLVAANDCGTCHDLNPGSGFVPSYAAEDENSTCLGCHDTIAPLTEKPVIHPPFEGERCTACHSPHASGTARMLRKPVNELCTTCHDDKNEGNHPVVFHPVGGRPDPRDEAVDISCVSCHNPHASDNGRLLMSPGGYFQLCQGCHKK